MKKIILLLFLLVSTFTIAFSQAKKPTIMVIPSDVWMNQNGYVMEVNDQGKMTTVPDYNKAVSTDADLMLAISKLGELMADREFPLKDLAACLKAIKNEEIEEANTTSKETGDMIAETPLEKITRVAKADILIDLTWTINTSGPKRSMTLNLRGLDAYTNKQIAAASGTGRSSMSSQIPVLLEESVLSYIDDFNNQLQNYFDDLFENGREVSLLCKRWSGSDVDFESEYDGEELSFLIENWVADNTVEGRFSTASATENRVVFEQVRIPLYNANGRAMDTRTWANGLRKMLRDKYTIDAKIETKGLGQAIITIGGK
ncbi:DUF6175 family protein [Porphyromonadaceae bacterium OttesenSCG-928-L07]|nr:DUF6175 family protein [Porphyromonadaceae bacterium OttesenSCG-928-L07]MDL2251957.1 DUF6175 family protein [Odoribacter sp. OttesenSCG-928-J03]MDL2283289.1 DUF6175 family protein [Odoribacter sp. OttesenSCG-928-G04]